MLTLSSKIKCFSLRNEVVILGRYRESLKDLFNTDTHITGHETGVYKEENTTIAILRIPHMKTLKVLKAAGCHQIKQELHKSLKREVVLCLTRVFQVT